MTDDIKAMRVTVTGQVQGVGFRDWTLREADALGLTGWVRNEDDGSVTALIAGARAAVDEMVGRLREGPENASVTSLGAQAADIADAPANFRIVG